MKTMQLVLQFLLIVSGIAAGQELTFRRPDVIGRWLVAESWDVSLNERLEIARTDVVRGLDNIWIFKSNQELDMIEPLHMVDPIRQTYIYRWRWLNDTTLIVIPGSKGIYLLCHLLDASPSRLVFISSVAEENPQQETSSLYVLRVLKRTN